MEFFSSFRVTDETDAPSHVKRIGMDIEYFSNICGRTLLVGHITYISDKNFKSKKCLQTYLESNTIRVPAVVVLTEEDHALNRVKNYDNFFIQRRREIVKDMDSKFRMYGMLQEVNSRKTTHARAFGASTVKKKRYFKFKTKERFCISVRKAMIANKSESAKWLTKVYLHCNFVGSSNRPGTPRLETVPI